MVEKKADRDIVDQRLEDTLDLFQPTAQQEAAALEAADKAESKPAPKSRAWDRQPENRLFSYRLGQDLDDLVREAVAEYKAEGWHTTRGAVLRAWALAGRELWIDNQIDVPGRPAGEAGTRRRKE